MKTEYRLELLIESAGDRTNTFHQKLETIIFYAENDEQAKDKAKFMLADKEEELDTDDIGVRFFKEIPLE